MKAVRKPTHVPSVLAVAISAVAVVRSLTGNQIADSTGGDNVSTVPDGGNILGVPYVQNIRILCCETGMKVMCEGAATGYAVEHHGDHVDAAERAVA